jgi:CBS domain-containing protein
VVDDPGDGRIDGGGPGVDAGLTRRFAAPEPETRAPGRTHHWTQFKFGKKDHMSKTAREVMTPGSAWPGDTLGDIEPAQLVRAVQPAGPAESQVIRADDWVDRALATMTELKVRRLPVIDGGRMVGVISQGDLASSIDQPETWSWLCS